MIRYGIVLILLLVSQSAFAQDAPTKELKETIRPMKQGIIDMVGDQHTVVQARRAPDGAWTPHLQVYVHFPDFSSEDVLKIQFKKGSKKIGKPYACNAREIMSEFAASRRSPKHKVDLIEFRCTFPKDYAQKKAGLYTLDLSIRQVLLEKTTPIGSLELKTFNIKHGSQNNQKTLQTTSHDSVIGSVAFVTEGRATHNRKMLSGIADNHLRAQLAEKHSSPVPITLTFWSKTDDSSKERYKAACLYNGKKVGSASGVGGSSFGGVSSKYWSYRGKKNKDVIKWQQHNFMFPMMRVRHISKKGQPAQGNFHMLDENPGEYTCKFMSNGEVKASVKFEVKDGKVVKGKCDKDLNLPNNVTSVSFEDRGVNNTKIDKKLKKRIFYRNVNWSKGCPAK